MKRFPVLIAAVIAAAGCVSAPQSPSAAAIDAIVDTMSVRDKVAQLVSIEFYPAEDSVRSARHDSLILYDHIGGVILMDGALETAVDKINHLQSLATLPLTVSLDGEWGVSMRLPEFAKYPRQEELAKLRDKKLIYRMGREIAEEMKAMKIQVNYAPCVDINVNPDNIVIGTRSFSSDREVVSKLGALYAKGMQDGGVVACAKHFPGHGDTSVDSHKGLPVLGFDRARLDSLELYPFCKLIDEGVEMVMVGHLLVPELDTVPASVSRRVVTDLLRGELGFDGVVVTDALNMRGVLDACGGDPIQATLGAYKAGADILLMPINAHGAIDAIVEYVGDDPERLAELDAHLRRALSLKASAGLLEPDYDRMINPEEIDLEAGYKMLDRIDKDLAATREVKYEVPEPVFDGDRSLVALYNQAWKLADGRIMYQEGMPAPRYMDEGCLDGDGPITVWIWDTAFMSLFCKYSPAYFPGVESLNNFYGPILDEIDSPLRIHHPDNPPLFAWVEYDNYKFTDDKQHLDSLVLINRYLQRHYEYFNTLDNTHEFGFRHQKIELKNMGIGFDWNGCPSGMDNTPRNADAPILWIDAISQQALSALYISRLAEICGDSETVGKYGAEYERLKDIVNKYYWDDEDGCYYDIYQKDSTVTKMLTIASFWPMLAEIPSQEQAERMCAFALADDRLGGEYPWKSLDPNEPTYVEKGGKYWRGAIWLPTAYMGVKALEKYGLQAEADQFAERLVQQINRTYKYYKPHTIWECYSPSEDKPARGKRDQVVRPDFCGWSALGPISLFIENVIGISDVNAQQRTVRWNVHQTCRHGLRQLRFGDVVTDLVYEDGTIHVSSNAKYSLVVNGETYPIRKGKQRIRIAK